EERVLPFALVDAAPVLVPDAAVVCIHERVTAALQLVVNAGIRLEIIGARAAARDELGVQASRSQSLDDRLHQSDGFIEPGLAVLVALQVLHGALISLQAAESQRRCGIDGLRNPDCGARSA